MEGIRRASPVLMTPIGETLPSVSGGGTLGQDRVLKDVD